MKYSLVLFLLLDAFSSNKEFSKNNFFIDRRSIYSHKGKFSLAFGVTVPFLLDRIVKYPPLKNKVYLLNKYPEWSLFKKISTLSPFGVGSSIISYLLIANIPFTQNKTVHFMYPQSKEVPNKKNNEENIRKELKELELKIGEEHVINDASYLNKTSVAAIVIIESEEDIKKILKYAAKKNLKVSIAGARHSMGGQAFVENGIVLDMNEYKDMKMTVDGTLLVQSGALFSDIQHFLDSKTLSVKAMQSVNFCTVGGTLAANAHGIAHDPGCIGATVKSMRVMLADGQIKKITPTDELFGLVIGGYGLCGIILDAELEVVKNETYEWKRKIIDYTDFPKYFKHNIENKEDIGLFHGRLSVSPGALYMKETFVNTYEKIDNDQTKLQLIKEAKDNWLIRPVIEFSKTGGIGRWTRMVLEKYLSPFITPKKVTRNQQMYNKMSYLKNPAEETEILQEYFVPHDKMVQFIDGLRDVVQKSTVNLLNVTIRSVKKDTITKLPYAKDDMFAFVLYFNQRFNQKESQELEKVTKDLIDTLLEANGTFYLPYKLYYTKEQLSKAYPAIDEFFRLKKKYDPQSLFSNAFYEKYGTALS